MSTASTITSGVFSSWTPHAIEYDFRLFGREKDVWPALFAPASARAKAHMVGSHQLALVHKCFLQTVKNDLRSQLAKTILWGDCKNKLFSEALLKLSLQINF